MFDHPQLRLFGDDTAAEIIKHFTDGALFVLIGRGPKLHSVLERSGEFWTSETLILGILKRYLPIEEARRVYRSHCDEYGDEWRHGFLVNAYFSAPCSSSTWLCKSCEGH